MDKLTYEVGSIATMGIEGVDTSGGKMSLADANIEYSVDSEKVIVIKEKSNEHITIQCVGVGVAYIDIVAELNGIKVKNKQRITIVGESKLPAPWEIANFKNASGYVSEENGIFTLLSNGDNVYGNEDDATFMYQKVENTENYTITATINSVASVGSGNTASGLMIRSGNDANDYNLHLRLQGGAGLMMTYRNSDNLYSNYHKGPAVSLPVDIKLEKKGDIIGGYYKEDGKWILIAEYSVPTGNNSLAGIALFSNVADVFVDSKVSNINITK
jgi:argonaute-like protein implicated in RNA metabolism and viral defense